MGRVQLSLQPEEAKSLHSLIYSFIHSTTYIYLLGPALHNKGCYDMCSARASRGAAIRHQQLRSQQLVAQPPSLPHRGGLSKPAWQVLGTWGARSLARTAFLHLYNIWQGSTIALSPLQCPCIPTEVAAQCLSHSPAAQQVCGSLRSLAFL